MTKKFSTKKIKNINKKAAIPEYIWYVSLIAVTLGLIVVINSITSKSTKQATSVKEGAPFSVASMEMTTVPGKDKTLRIESLLVSPKVKFKKEDLGALYLLCSQDDPTKYAKIVCLKKRSINKSVTNLKSCSVNDKDIDITFTQEGTGTLNLFSPITFNYNDWNTSGIPINNNCFEKGAVWYLYYSEPDKGGTRVYDVTVN